MNRGDWIELDGVIHVVGSDCCSMVSYCWHCDSKRHMTGGHMGPVDACEGCDARLFKPAPVPVERADRIEAS